MMHKMRNGSTILTIALFAFVVAFPFCVPQDAAAAQNAQGFGQSWLLLGQYNQGGGAGPSYAAIRQDYMTDGVITETSIIPTAGQVVDTDYAIAASTGFNPGTQPLVIPTVWLWNEPDDLVDYNGIYGDFDNLMNYAFTYVDNAAAVNTPCEVGVGSDDSIQVVINGVEVWANSVPRGSGAANEVQDAAPCTLLPGRNLVMVKVFEGGGGHNFRLRFQPVGDGTGVKTTPGLGGITYGTVPGTYTYPALASGTRAIGGVGLYIGGDSFPITVTVLKGNGTPTVAVTETPPAGWTVSGLTVDGGDPPTVAAGTITWNIPNMSSPSVTMNYTVTAGAAGPDVTFTGQVQTALTLPIGGPDFIYGPAPIGAFDWSGDIGTPGDPSVAGSAGFVDPTYTITASGSDVWGNADHGHFIVKKITGDWVMDATPTWIDVGPNTWSKVGLMARQNIYAGGAHAWSGFRNPANTNDGVDACFQWRDIENGASNWNNATPYAAGARLRVLRLGNTVVGYVWDGSAWVELVGSPHTVPDLDGPDALLCLWVTSHENGSTAQATFSDIWMSQPSLRAATRDIQATSYSASTPITVVINLDRQAAGAVDITDNVPAGWTPSGGGGTVVGQAITFAGVTGNSVTYTATPGAGASVWPAIFQGSTIDLIGITVPITGESSISPAGRTVFQHGSLPDSSYTGAKDTYIIMYGTAGGTMPGNGDPPYGDRNQGAHTAIEEGDWRGIEDVAAEGSPIPGWDDNKLILLQFDLMPLDPMGIPRLSTVTDARLRLWYFQERRGPDDPQFMNDHHSYVHMINREWGEGTGTGADGPAALTGEACWMSAQTNIQDWETSGCRGFNDLRPITQFASQSTAMYGTTLNVWVEYDVTDFVQEWVNNSGRNYGMKISQDDLGSWTTGYHQGAYMFTSKENSDVGHRPTLSVEWTPAGPSMDATRWSLYR